MSTDPRWQQADAWNTTHSPGCCVWYQREDGKVEHATTRSRATVLSNHGAIVWLENVIGCVSLDRVVPMSNPSIIGIQLCKQKCPDEPIQTKGEGNG